MQKSKLVIWMYMIIFRNQMTTTQIILKILRVNNSSPKKYVQESVYQGKMHPFKNHYFHLKLFLKKIFVFDVLFVLILLTLVNDLQLIRINVL